MKYQVRLSAKAERDVAGILDWFDQQQAMEAAGRWFDTLWRKLDTLETMPLRCSRAAEAVELQFDLRELHFGSRRDVYRILFMVEGRRVTIRHAARDSATLSDL